MWEHTKYTTLEPGTRIKTESGEKGKVVSNDRLKQYEIQLDRQTGTSFFEYWSITPLEEE